ncbi:restriction endonuclease [Neobacillus mesonae]|nr:restriction endonuclease [Neobacillus mesonae]
MNIINVAGKYSRTIEFGSKISLLEYDVILIDLLEVVNEYRLSKHSEYPTEKISFNTHDRSSSFKIDIARKRKEIDDFLSLGRTIFVYTPAPLVVSLLNGYGERTEFDLREELLPDYPDTDLAKGYKIELVGNPIFESLFTNFQGLWCYNSAYKEIFGEPIFKVINTESYVGASVKVGPGNIVFIPRILENDETNESKLLDHLITIAKNINKSPDLGPTLPDWSSYTEVPRERDTKQALVRMREELQLLESKIETVESDLNSLEELKLLFTSSGTYLEKIVGKIFTELGFDVTEGIPGRDDLILEYNGRIAVVEVKGVTKSAAEKHAAQLEKWVSEYITNKEKVPKGILIVNAFKDTPLQERNEKPFPDQMMNYSNNRNHCLLTGLDLLSLYSFVQENPEQKEEVINSLFNTCGHFNKYDWKDYISINDLPSI